MSKEYLYLPRVRLYTDNQRDIEIQNWLKSLPSGIKSETIKQVMWASISGEQASSRSATYLREQPYYKPESKAMPTSAKMSASVTFDTRELLADIRQIVEVSVAQGFAHHGYVFGQAAAPEQKDEVEVEALLNDLDMSFMLDDDDDDDEEE